MRPSILIAALLGSTLIATAARSGDDDCNAPMSRWQPRAAVEAKARDMGWEVRRIRTDDGCYKVYGRDATGRALEAEFNPATLELIELEWREPHSRGTESREDAEGDPPQQP